MCIDNIKVTVEIPCKAGEPDRNDWAYSKEALRRIADTAAGKPVIVFGQPSMQDKPRVTAQGGDRVIGVVNGGSYNGSELKFECSIFRNCGTNETVPEDAIDGRTITLATLESIGII